MLDLAKIQSIAQSYSPQELFAALVWQRRFNEFDGEEVITDLSQHTDLWASFLFTKPIFPSDKNSLSFSGVVDTLLAMANYRPMPETSIIHFIAYPADTLYILAENQDTKVSQLLDLGKKWRADSVEVSDGTNEDYGWQLQRRLRTRLEGALWGKEVRARSRCSYCFLLVGLSIQPASTYLVYRSCRKRQYTRLSISFYIKSS